MEILNLTQHVSTAEQAAAGVVEPANKKAVQALLTFEEIPTKAELTERAEALFQLAKAHGAETVMIGGAPFFMGPLEHVFFMHGLKTVHAFSKRVVVEETQADGSVKKTAVFRHAGFVGL